MAIDSKLKWRCRRGTRELDFLLGGFFDRRYNDLSQRDQALFASLLEQQDPVIQDWIWGHAALPNDDMKLVVELIRDDAGIS